MTVNATAFIHESAYIDDGATIGADTKVCISVTCLAAR